MCRKLVKQINVLAFFILEKETWDKLEKDLSDIVKDLKLQAPHEVGFIKESSSYVRFSPMEGIHRDPLPKPKKGLHYPEELELKQKRRELPKR